MDGALIYGPFPKTNRYLVSHQHLFCLTRVCAILKNHWWSINFLSLFKDKSLFGKPWTFILICVSIILKMYCWSINFLSLFKDKSIFGKPSTFILPDTCMHHFNFGPSPKTNRCLVNHATSILVDTRTLIFCPSSKTNSYW